MYIAQCAAIASTYEIDRALLGLTDQIARNPESFPVVGQTGQFRLGKSDAWGGVPRLRILFEILDEHRVLLAIIRAETEVDFIEGF